MYSGVSLPDWQEHELFPAPWELWVFLAHCFFMFLPQRGEILSMCACILSYSKSSLDFTVHLWAPCNSLLSDIQPCVFSSPLLPNSDRRPLYSVRFLDAPCIPFPCVAVCKLPVSFRLEPSKGWIPLLVLSRASQSCASCCPVSESPWFLYDFSSVVVVYSGRAVPIEQEPLWVEPSFNIWIVTESCQIKPVIIRVIFAKLYWNVLCCERKGM